MNSDEGNSKIVWFRFITPILVTIVLFIVSLELTTISKIDNKLFLHLTNDNIHTPKDFVVTRAEFNLYQIMRDKQMSDVRDVLVDVKKLVEKHVLK